MPWASYTRASGGDGSASVSALAARRSPGGALLCGEVHGGRCALAPGHRPPLGERRRGEERRDDETGRMRHYLSDDRVPTGAPTDVGDGSRAAKCSHDEYARLV
ncbi:MAG: hypothetical protein M3466_06915 [Gemmatimonadota bacterium]|nr:hypothetical protein [Gemmatimonadota bacterium]